ncbi:MAG: RsmB/NOP family class I SAM-dependent RNA methyltransferase [Ahrensia sp.]|nr:RsmB/NOP family class I SAM-dependent RNA methyltransferase [Ahrensia sp.]
MDLPGLAVRQAAATVLVRIIDDGRGLDGLLDSRHGPASVNALSDADMSLLRAIVTTACRHRGEIDYALNRLMKSRPPKNARHLLHTLHVAAAQILFLESPDSAAVNLAVASLKGDQRSTRFAALGNAVLRRLIRERESASQANTTADLARLNTPDWLFKRLRKDYGRDRAQAIATIHMLEPVIDLTVKEDPQVWAQKLSGIVLRDRSLRVPKTGSITQWPGYDEGAWWIQDAAAAVPATLLGDISGKSVADLCAAPGGKTAQLAALGAYVTAVEQSAPRMRRLRSNLQRLGLSANCVEADLLEWQPDAKFDAVLLDAPCSSTGTIRRHPDVQWTKSAEIVTDLAKLQKAMLQRAAEFVAPGGCLVFANCSILREEGEDIVATLDLDALDLALHPIEAAEVSGLEGAITKQGTLRTLPHHLSTIPSGKGLEELGLPEDFDAQRLSGLDGFFVARFTKLA